MDNEASGQGNQYDYGFRIYNPRLGRFLSEDPLSQSYPWYTPYQFAGNKPTRFIDRDGAEEEDPFGQADPAVELAELTVNLWNNAVDGLGNLLLMNEENKMSGT